eukprot:Plantae.Rhodophyta-Hildenbrandia_rubra.ctg20533.p1 GENE.Plantae.Rhodophyta-Hildenbrandia_rubra.ctg20533~~Plantae.Rhodophyta-Hildenbrandia_rubra.ctg20533.p1  ORF type:complete len:337 (-),score=42.74 Plantae.Rhodophyta-Hildenbrandia_rubra.ctg20533:630-1640(-)
MTLRSVIITGATGGLGYQCAKTLTLSKGYHVIIASRNSTRVENSVTNLQQLARDNNHSSIDSKVSGYTLDLNSLTSVRKFVSEYESNTDREPLYGVVCNAGISPLKPQVSEDGIEGVFQVNHLSHYLLCHLLSDEISKINGRIVFVSSGTHIPGRRLPKMFGVLPPKYHNAMSLAYPDKAPKDHVIEVANQRYSTSKLCNVLCAYEFARQFTKKGVKVGVFAMDPGLMPGTELARDFPKFVVKFLFVPLVSVIGVFDKGIRYPDVSGRDLAGLISKDSLENETGVYFDGEDKDESSPESYDEEKARDLWNTSAKLCGLNQEDTILPLIVGKMGGRE